MCRARRGGPRTLSRTTDANLDCAFVENALVFVIPKIGCAWTPPICPLYDKALMLQIKETGGWNLICGSFKAQGDSRLVVTVYINGEKVKSSLDDTDIGRSVKTTRNRFWNHTFPKIEMVSRQNLHNF